MKRVLHREMIRRAAWAGTHPTWCPPAQQAPTQSGTHLCGGGGCLHCGHRPHYAVSDGGRAAHVAELCRLGSPQKVSIDDLSVLLPPGHQLRRRSGGAEAAATGDS